MDKKIFRILTWVVLLHSALFIIFWLTNTAFHLETNNFLTKMIGARLDYLSYCLMFSGLLGIWSVLRLLLHKRQGSPYWYQVAGNWLYTILGVIYLVFFYGSFAMLFNESPIQKTRLLQLLNYYRVILDPLLLLGITSLVAWRIRKINLDRKWTIVVLIGLAILWSLPLVFPPPSVLRGKLPNKPLLVAHRGADALAPENTLAAAQKAAELGVFGQEADIQISVDGRLFLMHDDTLTRTTNVGEIYPQRAKDPAGSFTWDELAGLDAGSWFSRDDPFGTIHEGLVSPEQADGFRGEKIPSLEDWLAVIQASGQTFLYDVKSSQADDPVNSGVYEMVLDKIKTSGMEGQAWILAGRDQIDLVTSILPKAVLAVGISKAPWPTAAELVEAGYKVVNAEYSLPVSAIRDYQAENLWVNIYTVDETWQYSRLWIAGVDSTTSNNLIGLMALEKPVLSLPYITYVLVLVFAGVAAIGINRLIR